jgi:hypothetical protein
VCGPAEIHQYLGGMYCLHLQAQRESLIRNQQKLDSKQSLLNSRFDPEEKGRMFLYLLSLIIYHQLHHI